MLPYFFSLINSFILTTVSQAGDATVSGYAFNTENLLYFYKKVGPTSLTLSIAVYTDADTDAPNVPEFGFMGSPSTVCAAEELEPSQCIAPFVLYHNLPLAEECAVEWLSDAGIVYQAAFNTTVSEDYAAWYLQAGGWNSPNLAIDGNLTCDELNALHTFTNRLGNVFGADMPFGGFRDELWVKIINEIKVLPSIGEFWKSSYLEEGSPFYRMNFASYQGLCISFPAKARNTSYNPLIQPWYSLAAANLASFVVTTPYEDFSTGELVMSGATAIIAPNTTHTFGVVAFDYKFSEFLDHWNDTLSAQCQTSDGHFCYLIDSNAFLLYYEGIADDINDDDISHKFFGDFEPTLMQNLLDIGFFKNSTHRNYLDDSLDISYFADEDVYELLDLNATQRNFEYNSGLYTVHQISETNLYLVHVDGWSQSNVYPSDCPEDPTCSSVRSPGCIMDMNDDCVSIAEDICANPDIVTLPTCEVWECIIEPDVRSDFCATNFLGDCGPAPIESPTKDPTIDPTADPTGDPTEVPTADPTTGPTMDPTAYPTVMTNVFNSSKFADVMNSLKTELNTLFCSGLSVGGTQCEDQYGIQNFIGSFHEKFEAGVENGNEVVKPIMDRVEEEMNVRAGFLTNLSAAINSSCFSYRWGAIAVEDDFLVHFETSHFGGNTDRAASLPSDMAYNEVYGREVSLTKSTYRLPSEVDYNDTFVIKDVQLSYILEQTMVDLHNQYCVDELSDSVVVSSF